MEIEFKCRYEAHENESIMGFCLNKNCSKPSQFCFKCLQQVHQDHSDDCIRFNLMQILIDQSIQTENERFLNYRDIQNQLSQAFNNIFKQLESNIIQLREIEQHLKDQSYISFKQQIPFIKNYYLDKKEKELMKAYKENENTQDQQNYTQILLEKGNELFNKGMYDEALIFFDDSLKCLYNLKGKIEIQKVGMALNILNSYQDAIECYDQAIKIDPNYSNAFYNKGNVLFNMNNYQNAIQCYDKAIQINSKDSDAFYNKGNTLSTLNRYQDAIECYDQAIKINSSYSDAFYNKGKRAMGEKLFYFLFEIFQLKRFSDAIKCYDQALSILQKPLYMKNKADTLIYLNEKEESKKWYLHAQNAGYDNDAINQILKKI